MSLPTPTDNGPPLPGQTWQDLGIPEPTRGRPRGWMDTPHSRRDGTIGARIIEQVPGVLADWTHPRPPSTRFVAYRATGRAGLGHDQVDYAEDEIGLLRRSGVIPFAAVSDNRTESVVPWTPTVFASADRADAVFEGVRAKRQAGQPWRVMVVAEAGGTLPLLQDVCDEFGVPLYSGSGSVPMSLTQSLAVGAVGHWARTREQTETVILCVTDLDANGLKNIFQPFSRDVEAFARHPFRDRPDIRFDVPPVHVRRIGVTPDQVLDHVPPSVRQGGAPRGTESWWPTDRNGDRWVLPQAEVVMDVLPDVLADALGTLLPDEERRSRAVAAESRLRSRARSVLRERLEDLKEAS